MGNLEIVTTADRQDLDEQARNAFRPGWPEFIFHDPVSSEHLGRVETYFPQYDVLLLDEDQVVAGGWGVPIRWNGTIGTLPDGYDGALISAVTGHEKSVPADTLMHHGRRGQGRPARQRAGGPDPHRTPHPSRQRRAATCDRTGQANAQKPVSAHADGKLARWARSDGLHIDPWIRTHQRLGASILASAPRSMIITATVAEWEDWAGMVSGNRPVHRARCAGSGHHRPRARSRDIQRNQPMDAPRLNPGSGGACHEPGGQR